MTDTTKFSAPRRVRRIIARMAAVVVSSILVTQGYGAPAAAASPVPEELKQLGPGLGGFVSENVSYVGTIPLDSPGVGGRVVKVGKQVRFYVTGLKGLSIYDVTDPALPIPLGTFPFPHAQNEDVDVSEDGKRVIISADGALLIPIFPHSRGIHVIDTSDPMMPTLLGSINEGNHTSTCADAKCKWLYGSSGDIYDARDPANITNVGTWSPTGGGGHDLNRDATGLVISDTNPRLVLDPRKNPANPKVLASGMASEKVEPRYQHNNLRPRAEKWKPRKKGTKGYNGKALRPGELLISNSETNLNPTCGDQGGGGLSTWSMANFDKGARLKQLHAFSPMNGDYASSGDPAINALGCSGHWFTERNNILAAGWYEHGIRFVKVNPTNGKLNQVGFFQPVVTEASAAYWIPGPDGSEYVYSVDYARGIDILKFDRKAAIPTPNEFNRSWLANIDSVGALSERERYLCRIAQ